MWRGDVERAKMAGYQITTGPTCIVLSHVALLNFIGTFSCLSLNDISITEDIIRATVGIIAFLPLLARTDALKYSRGYSVYIYTLEARLNDPQTPRILLELVWKFLPISIPWL